MKHVTLARSSLLATLAIPTLAVSTPAQLDHFVRTQPGIGGGLIAADPAASRIVGIDSQALLQAWTYSTTGSGWSLQSGTPMPFAGNGATLVTRGTGANAVVYALIRNLGLSFHLVGNNWVQLTTNPAPPIVDYALTGLSNGDVLMFGGVNTTTSTLVSTTFRLTGSVWSPVTTANAPSPRVEASLASDGAGGAVLFGGTNSLTATAFSDTWRFDGTNWSPVTTSVSPPGRWGAGMAFRPSVGEFTIVGGTSAGTILTDVWILQGIRWYQSNYLSGIPFLGYKTSAALDPIHNEVIAGSNTGPTVIETLHGTQHAGQGCPCVTGAPPFFVQGTFWYTPIGSSMGVYAPYFFEPAAPIFYAVGTSVTPPVQVQGLPSGCFGQIGNVFSITLSPTMAINLDFTLIGLELDFQAMQFPAGQFAGCVSNVARVFVGRP